MAGIPLGRFVNFTAASRKPALINFGLFSPADASWISNIQGVPGAAANQFTLSTAPFAASLVIDTSVADVISVTLAANVTSFTLNYNGTQNMPTGWRVWIRIIENGTGGWTLALPANLVTEATYAIDTRANRATVWPIMWNGTKWIFFAPSFSVPQP